MLTAVHNNVYKLRREREREKFRRVDDDDDDDDGFVVDCLR